MSKSVLFGLTTKEEEEKKHNSVVTPKTKIAEMACRWIMTYIYVGEESCLSAREGGTFPLLFHLSDQSEAEGMMAWWSLVDLHSDPQSSHPVGGHCQTGEFWLQRTSWQEIWKNKTYFSKLYYDQWVYHKAGVSSKLNLSHTRASWVKVIKIKAGGVVYTAL